MRRRRRELDARTDTGADASSDSHFRTDAHSHAANSDAHAAHSDAYAANPHAHAADAHAYFSADADPYASANRDER